MPQQLVSENIIGNWQEDKVENTYDVSSDDHEMAMFFFNSHSLLLETQDNDSVKAYSIAEKSDEGITEKSTLKIGKTKESEETRTYGIIKHYGSEPARPGDHAEFNPDYFNVEYVYLDDENKKAYQYTFSVKDRVVDNPIPVPVPMEYDKANNVYYSINREIKNVIETNSKDEAQKIFSDFPIDLLPVGQDKGNKRER